MVDVTTHPDTLDVADQLATGAIDAVGSALVDALYAWYLNSSPLPTRGGPVLPCELDMAGALRAAHANVTSFGGGWRADHVSNWGQATATRGGLQRMVDRGEYSIPSRPGIRAEPGDPLAVSNCWDWSDADSGFWYCRRGEWPPPAADRIIRLYWNCAPAAAPVIVAHLTAALSEHGDAPYHLKTLLHPDHRGRADALVLYLAPDDYIHMKTILRSIAEGLGDHLRSSTPRWATRIVAGVAMAEGNLRGDSFGQARALLVADAFDSASLAGRSSAVKLAALIDERFRDAGLDPARPHLEPSGERTDV